MTHVNGNSVSAVLEVSRKVYATSLVLYPNELRREFGAEMVEVFGQDPDDGARIALDEYLPPQHIARAGE